MKLKGLRKCDSQKDWHWSPRSGLSAECSCQSANLPLSSEGSAWAPFFFDPPPHLLLPPHSFSLTPPPPVSPPFFFWTPLCFYLTPVNLPFPPSVLDSTAPLFGSSPLRRSWGGGGSPPQPHHYSAPAPHPSSVAAPLVPGQASLYGPWRGRGSKNRSGGVQEEGGVKLKWGGSN